MNRPVVLLVHGAFAESASWNRVIRRLRDSRLTAVAVANPLRGFEGSTLGQALQAYPVASGGDEFRIDPATFHRQFCADLDSEEAALMAATQRPVTERALSDGLAVDEAPWRTVPSWFVHGDKDRNIPAAALRFMAERADSRGTREIAGASHALAASQPDAVTATILDAADHARG
ncbi:alpha/beta fold hydrolase [Nonomuraea sp. NPDC003560]|uniref:alpha/beta fold hydrolase n=1 Tax=Nonomuraea sp. NPDC003560 TaxID=3364341 RepID=UPI0036A79F43